MRKEGLEEKQEKEDTANINQVQNLDGYPETYLAEYQKGEIVKKKLPCVAGIYVKGVIQGVETWFTVDTGASRTIISKRIFRKIEENTSIKLKRPAKGRSLEQAGGTPLLEFGRGSLKIEIGSFSKSMEVIVGDIKDEILLGMDIGTMDVLTSKGLVVLDGHKVPCITIKSEKSRKVFAAETYKIPGYSEMIIEGNIEARRFTGEASSRQMVIEPVENFGEKYALGAAPTIVNLEKHTFGMLRVINPSNATVTIAKGATVGIAESLDQGCQVLLDSENVQERHNMDCVRRISLSLGDTTTGIIRKVNSQEKDDNYESGTQTDFSGQLPEAMREMFQKAAKGRSYKETEEIFRILQEYSDVFSKDDYDLGYTHLAEHAIDTGDAVPVKYPPRRVPMAMAGEEVREIQNLKARNIIQESNSPWASPIVMTRKKNGKVRLCCDYRHVNQLTKKDAYALPRTQDCLDAMAGSVIYSTLDMTSGYHQVPIRPEDRSKTAFVTKHGLWEYKTMPFGLCNAPATFQRLMELALRGLQWTSCLIYLDDVIVFAANLQEHASRLRQVLERMRQANFKLKPEKCNLFQSETEFLGHIVSSKGVRPNPNLVSKILQWPIPQNVSEVRQFLGLASYYRRFIRNFSKVAKPLTELTCKDAQLTWKNKHEEAFNEIKKALTGPSIMAYPQHEGKYILDTDACDVGIGAVLSQIQDDNERVIAYASRSLNKSERNYCVTDKELLAVRYFVEYFHHYLLGRHFTIRTDHQALKWLFGFREPKGRIARWLEILAQYQFDIEYRPGKGHGNADALSRCPNPRECTCPEQDNLENLRCGPCSKCRKRANDMQHVTAGGKETIHRTTLPQHPLPVSEDTVPRRKDDNTESKKTSDTLEDFTEEFLDDGRKKPKLVTSGINHVSRTTEGTGLMPDRGSPNLRKRDTEKEGNRNNWSTGYSIQELKDLQEKDPNIGPIHRWQNEGVRPYGTSIATSSPETRHYWNYWSSLELENGLLFKRFYKQNGTGSYLQFITPRAIREEVMRMMHDSILAGHLGRKKTTDKILQRYYWYELREDVNIWLKKCDTCAANKKLPKTPRAPLGDMRVGAPLDRISIDVLGPLPLTPRGNQFILVVADHFSKWTEAYAMPDQTAKTCADIILTEFISRFGCPIDIHSDQGRNFESNIFRELCHLLGIRKTRTSPRHPQGNGQVERFNRTLLKMIKSYIQHQEDWDLYLGCLTAAYRSTPCDSTGMTPNMIMLGKEVRLPLEIVTPAKEKPQATQYGEYVGTLRENLIHAHEITRKHLEQSALRQQDAYDCKVQLHRYQPGDQIWYLNEMRRPGISPKLQDLYLGPVLVIKAINDLNYLVQFDRKGTKKVIHHDKLKPYSGTQKVNWILKARKNLLSL